MHWVVPATFDRRFTGRGAGVATLLIAGLLPAQALDVTLDGAAEGRTYQGHGAVSAGATTRLLIDYPEPQRSEILDYLFKPGYGAALQHLKVEIGGEVVSGAGTEPTHMRTTDDQDYHRGYEWWLMKEARVRNPEIILDCLAWGAPGWIGGGNYWSQDMADYVANFLNGAQRIHQLDINYTGVRNESTVDTNWILTLRQTLDAAGLAHVKIVAGDEWNGTWNIVDDILANPGLSNAVYAVGAHYPSHQGHGSPAAAQGLGQPLWGSEEGIGGASWSKALSLARLYNRNYIVGKMTRNEIWSPISSYYDILTAPGSGLMRANEPWSGAYEVSPAIWATAHTTQFAQPGWTYLEGGASAVLPGGGSLVTLKSDNGSDYSIVVETSDAGAAQAISFHLTNGLSTAAMRVWKTTETAPFAPVGTLVPVDGTFSYTFDPGCIYSLSTVGGQARGQALPPPSEPFPLPYVEDFESYALGATPRYFSDQAGTFEVVAREDGPGQCLRQVLPQVGIRWIAEWNPYTVAGDVNWRDYEINADVLAETDGFISILGRVVNVPGFWDPVPRGYWLKLDSSPGGWELRDESRVLASGHVPFAPGVWHRVRLTFMGRSIKVHVDGVLVGDVLDGKYPSGMAAVGCGWHHARFDNVSLFPRHLGPRNLAPLATASASSVWQGRTDYDATRTNDQDASTRWNAGWPAQAQEWVELDFGTAVRFNRATLLEFADHVQAFRIQYWDGSGWVDAVTGNSIAYAWHEVFPIVTTTRARLLVDDMSLSPSLYEIQLYRDFDLSGSAPVVVNEWMIHNTSTVPDPADGQYAAWFELYHPGLESMDLAGYYLTGNRADPFMFQVPPGYVIPPGGHLLVWADEQPEQNTPGSDLHVNFSLTDAIEIAVFAPDGTQVDAVKLRKQGVDRSHGSVPDGTYRILPAATPTPRASNNLVRATSIAPGPAGAWGLAFDGIPNLVHLVETHTNPANGAWTEVDRVTANPDGRFGYGDATPRDVSFRMYRSDLP